MPARHHSARAREYGEVALHPSHGIMCEVAIEGVMLCASIMFLVGSCCFFGGEPFQVLQLGEILYMAASFIYVGVGFLEMYELCQFGNSGSMLKNSTFHEQMAYVVSAIIFTAGTVLYWPGIYGTDVATEAIGELAACWCFVIGSFGFVVAGFWNALSLADEAAGGDDEGGVIWMRLTRLGLFFSLLGGVFFTIGSYLYTLDTEEGCQEYLPESKTKQTGKWCVGVTDQGTILYIIGSVCYLAQAIINCVKLCIRNCEDIRAGYCEVNDYEGGDSDTDRILYDAEEAAE